MRIFRLPVIDWRSILIFAAFLINNTASYESAAAHELILDGITYPSAGRPEPETVANQILEIVSTQPDTEGRTDTLRPAVWSLEWNRQSPALDAILKNYKTEIGDLAYNSWHYIENKQHLADIYLERGERQKANRILLELEHLALAKGPDGEWRNCRSYESATICDITTVGSIIDTLFYTYFLMKDFDQARRINSIALDFLNKSGQSRPGRSWPHNGTQIVFNLILLGERDAARALLEELIADFINSSDIGGHTHNELIESLVYLEHLDDPDAREMFERAKSFFREVFIRTSGGEVIESISFGYFLFDMDARRKANEVLDEITDLVLEDPRRADWPQEHQWLIYTYLVADEITQSRKILALYRKLYLEQVEPRPPQERSVWTLPARHVLKAETLFSNQLLLSDASGAEETLTWLMEIGSSESRMARLERMARLQIEVGDLERAEELIDLISNGPKDNYDISDGRTYQRPGKTVYTINLYLLLSDALRERGNSGLADDKLGHVYAMAVKRPDISQSIDALARLLNRLTLEPGNVSLLRQNKTPQNLFHDLQNKAGHANCEDKGNRFRPGINDLRNYGTCILREPDGIPRRYDIVVD